MGRRPKQSAQRTGDETSNISRRRNLALADGGADYAAKRDEIIRIAATLFRENGYQSTRLVDVAVAAGMDRASIYYYVESKEELFREIIEGILDANLAAAAKIAAKAAEPVSARLRKIVDLLMSSYESNFPQMYVYIQEQMNQVAREDTPWAKDVVRKTRRFEDLVRDLIEEGIRAGEFRADISARLASNALFGMLNWTHRWFAPGRALGAKDVSTAFFAIFTGGMQAVQQAAAKPAAPSRRRRSQSPE